MAKLFPFYHQDYTQDLSDLKPFELNQRSEDMEDIKGMMDYRKRSGFDKNAIRGMKVYNVVQTARPDDDVSRIFLGFTRMIMDQGITQMSEGQPDFDFEPRGPSDHKKTIIWKHLVKQILADSNYQAHQSMFIRDLFCMGSGALEVFTDYPQKTLRMPNDKSETGFDEVVVRDFRRPKVGVRAINPLSCWRNPTISDPTQVPSSLRRKVFTWNQFAQDFGRAILSNGKPKFKNLNKLSKSTHVAVFLYQDEVRDVYRMYAVSFGNDSDGFAQNPPENISNAVLIFDSPLKIHEATVGSKVIRSQGLNIPGMCNVRWGTFFDSYDTNYQGTHSVYGMGLPQRIEAEDMVMQTIFNINIDNYRWSNTVVLNYEGSDGDSYMDVDANRFYGGEMVDGRITPQPLGIQRLGDYQGMVQMLEQSTIPSTSINHNQLAGGDTSKTAFEFAQRIRLANRGAEERLSRLENEVFKPVGKLVLSGALSELTVDEFEQMTEGQVELARENIKNGSATIQDFKDLDGKEPQRKVRKFIRIEGEKLVEDFKQTKKRKLDAMATDNTLRFATDRDNFDGTVSFIPLEREYVYPAEYIESGMLPDVVVDSKRMLGDLKAQDAQNMRALTDFIMGMVQAGLLDPQSVNFQQIVEEFFRFAGVESSKFFSDTDESPFAAAAQQAVEQIKQASLGSNVQPTPQPTGQGLPESPEANPAGQQADASLLEGVASGTL